MRPILSDKCFRCHGPDEATRKADLRLDTAEGATVDLGGYQAIKPGDPSSSSVLERMTSTDESLVMPPADSGLKLTPAEIERIRRWIADGARYEVHWAFRPLATPELSSVLQVPVPRGATEASNAAAARFMMSPGESPIDHFVRARLAKDGIAPSPAAAAEVLLRRIYLDLLGLPPSPETRAEFLQDSGPDALDRLLDRVLANPHLGERWGRHWLDQARYADTNGYTVDTERSIWPYRDWVISAINQDLTFDQFTVEQLAGDLLPNARQDQIVATGFHRNTLVNQEGGTDAEQFRNEAIVDRVNTTGAVWLGLTVGCSQCHNHKYDPLSQREYFQLFAFFNSGQDVNSVTPTLRVSTEEEERRLVELGTLVTSAKNALAEYDQRKKKLAESESGQDQKPADQKPADQKPADQRPQEKKSEEAKAVVADPEREQLAAVVKMREAERAAFEKSIPTTMVMRDLPKPRPTHVHIRGDFLRKGDAVEPAFPAFLPALATGASPTRLDLARWLVDGRNPLVPRVAVNRIWMRFFGEGLVETENDFGMQGTPPTHPELLDWLAGEFVRQGWSVKRLQRQIVLSATYRQSSGARTELNSLDPRNKLLARQNRVRVEAEIVRDVGLAASGLLTERLGGPSVYPPQPSGVYAFTQRSANWTTSTGANRFRRGLYTFFMRSAPYPMLTTFDTPRFDSVCTRRVRSNTPLQSLTMANDEAMIEVARALARRVVVESGADARARLNRLYELCFARHPDSFESDRFLQFLESQQRDFAASAADADKLAGGDWPASVPPHERAAWTAAARVAVNLDEFITRE